MATRRTSSRKAKDAASDFVKRVLSGTWEDHRDVSLPSQKAKKAKIASPAKPPAAKGSPVCSSHGGRPKSPASPVRSGHIGQSMSPVVSLPILKAEEITANSPKVKSGRGRGRPRKIVTAEQEPAVLEEKQDAEQSQKELEKVEIPEELSKSAEGTVDVQGNKGPDLTSLALSGAVPSGVTSAEVPPLVVRLSKKKRKRKRTIAAILGEGTQEETLTKENDPNSVPKKPDSALITENNDMDSVQDAKITNIVNEAPARTEERQPSSSIPELPVTNPLKEIITVKLKKKKTKLTLKSAKSAPASIDTTLIKEEPIDAPLQNASNCQNVPPSSCDETIKQEPVSGTSRAIIPDLLTQGLPGSPEDMDETDSIMPYPRRNEQSQYFSMFGLIKKSEIKDDSLRNKLHREAGGKLRRVIKPKMAPEMVYRKLTLTKSCVIQGGASTSSSREASPRLSHKARAAASEQVKPKPKISESKRPVIKLTMLELELAEKLLKSGDLQSVRHLLLEGKLPPSRESPKKKQWLKPPSKKKPERVVVDEPDIKEEELDEPVTQQTSVNLPKKSVAKVPLTKISSFGSSSDKDEASGSRRSSRQRGAQRKEWWHLLRAAPDEFEEDEQWNEEQKKLVQKRKVLQVRKERRLLMDQLSIKDEAVEMDIDEGSAGEDDTLPSSQESIESSKSTISKPLPLKRSLSEGDTKSPVFKKQKKETVAKTSDFGTDANECEDLNNEQQKQRRKDWILAKKIIDEAKSKGGEVPIESILLGLRKQELNEESLEAKAASPLKKKKKKKKKKRERDEIKASRLQAKRNDIIDKLKPLLKTFMEDTGCDQHGATMEMELESVGDMSHFGSVRTSIEINRNESETSPPPPALINDNSQCQVPHMCCVCWINDHMYCLNMKRIARDLPPSTSCLHYAPCDHYRRRKLEDKKLEDSRMNQHQGGRDTSILRRVTASDLFCSEEMPDSDESAPQSPKVVHAAEGTELLKVQLQARAAQIAQSLGHRLPVIATPMRLPATFTKGDIIGGEDDEPDEISDLEIPVNQHGAEIVIHAGRAYPPNHEMENVCEDGQSLWLESLQALKQPSPEKAVANGSKVEKSEKPNKMKIKVQIPTEKKDGPAPNLEDVGKHKLVRVKVQRVGSHKILLKQTQERTKGKEAQEILVREINLPDKEDGKPENFDMEWLSGILAEEAVKLASKNESPSLPPKPKRKRPEPEKEIPKSPVNPDKEDVSWAMVTISEEEEETQIDSAVVSDIEDLSGDTGPNGNIKVPNSDDPDQPITINKQIVEVPEALHDRKKRAADGSEMLTLTTKDIREEAPHLMEYIKNAGLARSIYRKLDQERKSLVEMVTESNYVKSWIQNDKEQKLCLQRALMSEKSMLQDEVRQKRDKANTLALHADKFISKCDLLEKRRTELEDEIEGCMNVLEMIQKAGMLSGHPQEIERLKRINQKVQDATQPKVAPPQDADSPSLEAKTEEIIQPNRPDDDNTSVTAKSEAVQDLPKKMPPKLVNPAKKMSYRYQHKSSLVPEKGQMLYLQPVSAMETSSATTVCANTPQIKTSSRAKMVVLQPVVPSTAANISVAQPIQAQISPSMAKDIAAGGSFTLQQLQAAGLRIQGPTASPFKINQVPAQAVSQGVGVPPAGDSVPSSHSAGSVQNITTSGVLVQSNLDGAVSSASNTVTANKITPVNQLLGLPMSRPIADAVRDMIMSKTLPSCPTMMTSAPVTQTQSVVVKVSKPSAVLQAMKCAKPRSPAPGPQERRLAATVPSTRLVKRIPLVRAPVQKAPSTAPLPIVNPLPQVKRIPLTGVVQNMISSSAIQSLRPILGGVGPPTRFVLSSLLSSGNTTTTVTTSSAVPLRGISQSGLLTTSTPGFSPSAVIQAEGGTPLLGPSSQTTMFNSTVLQPQSLISQAAPQSLLQGHPQLHGNMASSPSIRLIPVSQAMSQMSIPGLAKGLRVQTMTGQRCNLPQLSPSVLSAIGPNDQVVVLSAEQLKQLQTGPKPVQLRLPINKSPVVANSVSLMPIAPKPLPVVSSAKAQKPEKAKRRARKRIKDLIPANEEKQEAKHLRTESPQLFHSRLPTVNNNDLPSIVQELITEEMQAAQTLSDISSGTSLGPMEAFEALVQQSSESTIDNNLEVQEVEDLVQLAMADSNLPVGSTVTLDSGKPQLYDPDTPQVVQDLDYSQIDSFQNTISFEVVSSGDQLNDLPVEYHEEEISNSEAVTVELVNSANTVDVHQISGDTTDFQPKSSISAETSMLENYQNVVIMDNKDCCEFDQFLEEKRDKEVYSQDVYSQSSQESDVTPQQIEFDLL